MTKTIGNSAPRWLGCFFRARRTSGVSAFALGAARALALAALAASSASAATLAGQVALVGKDGKAITEGADLRHLVVSFQPASPRAVKVREQPYEMGTRGKEFTPAVLAVPRGATVRFPNYDPILHNVFSVSGENRFDLGLYSKGAGKPYTFKTAGVARVFCNVHPMMVGYVVVLDTDLFAMADAQGRFSLTVPDGGGSLTLWHPQTEPLVVQLKPGSPLPAKLTLTVVRERVPSHQNKHGKPYARDRRDQYDG